MTTGLKKLIAVDWGTTRARAHLVEAGTVTATVAALAGVGTIRRAEIPQRLASLIDDLDSDADTILLSGMVGGAAGWIETPYVRAPVSIEPLAVEVHTIPDAELPSSLRERTVGVIPGVDTYDGTVWDVMRGEETEFFGQSSHARVVVAPGSHSKWITGSDDHITDFRTYLTGETFAALSEHTLLRQTTRTGPHTAPDEAAFLEGVDAAQSGRFLSTLFQARTRGLAGNPPAANRAWLSGLLIGREIHEALHDLPEIPTAVAVLSGEKLGTLYRRAFHHLGIRVETSHPHCAALGAWRIGQLWTSTL